MGTIQPAEGNSAQLSIEVRDDGTGFGAVMPSGVGSGLGLASMRERAEELGGRLTLDSTSAGTTVRAFLRVSESS